MEMTQRSALEALRAVEALLSGIETASLDACPDEELVQVMRTARTVRRRVEALACVATEKADRRKASMKAAGTPTASLISIDENLNSAQGVGEVRLAADATRHTAPTQAALDGRISVQQAAAITKAIASLPDLDEEVTAQLAERYVETAGGVPAKQLARLAPRLLAEVAPDKALTRGDATERAERERAAAVQNRRFAWGNDGEGSVWFKGQLPELEAKPLVRTLTALVAAQKRAERDQDAELRAANVDPWTRRDITKAAAQRTPLQRNADALTALVACVTGSPASPLPLPGVGALPTRAQIRVTISLADLMEGAGAGGFLDSGTELTPGQLRRLMAEAEFNVDEMCLLCKTHHGIIEPDVSGRRDQWRIEFDPLTGRPEAVPPRRLRTRAG